MLEVKKPFDLETFKLEAKDKIEQLRQAHYTLNWAFSDDEGKELPENEKQFLREKEERLYKEVIDFLTDAYLESGQNTEVIAIVVKLMNLGIESDDLDNIDYEDIPVFDNKGSEVLQDFTKELLSRTGGTPDAARGDIKKVLTG